MGKYVIYVMVRSGNDGCISGVLTNTALSGFIPFDSLSAMMMKINISIGKGDFFRSKACGFDQFNRISLPKHERFFAVEIYSCDNGDIQGCYRGSGDGGKKFFSGGLDLIMKIEAELNK